jgi:hypothetical protein
MDTFLSYFERLYRAAKTNDTVELDTLLNVPEEGTPEIWVDIKDPEGKNITVAGKLAGEGGESLEAAKRLCRERHASWNYVVEGLIRASVDKPEFEGVACDLSQKYHVPLVVQARAYATIGDKLHAMRLYRQHYKDNPKHDYSEHRKHFYIRLD